MKRTLLLISILVLATCCTRPAKVELPAIFGDNMVLQRGQPVRIWGRTNAGAVVKISWRGTAYKVTADSLGNWETELKASDAGGPFKLNVGDTALVNILVGDLYLCSGQSNMELPVSRCLDMVAGDVKGYSNDKIRYIKVPLSYNFNGPAGDIQKADWQVLDSDSTAMSWGAVCYFTAKALQEKTGVPVGMINSSVGGSPIEAWMREGILPEAAKAVLAPFKDESYTESMKKRAENVYSHWWNTYSKTPYINGGRWEPVDIFSNRWAYDHSGKIKYGRQFLRKTVELNSVQAGSPSILHLGAIIDADSVFVNGKFAGTTAYRYPPRNYKLPAGMFHEGDNTIEVHLFVFNSNPGTFVKDKRYCLETADGDIPLTSGWEHRDGKFTPERADEIFLQYQPSGLYNAMIAPIKGMRTSGVIWYQGESNIRNAAQYGGLLESMISDWRREMGSPDLPFYIIELATYKLPEATFNAAGWAKVQEEQKRAADETAGPSLVPNPDLCECNNIHPQNNKALGERIPEKILTNNTNNYESIK